MKYNVYSASMWMLISSGFRREIAKNFDKNYAISVMHRAKREYREIILRTEGIGGMQNPLLMVFILSALVVAVYKSADNVNSCGLTYTECGICKLFKQENCYELAKQMCKFDFTQTEMMGINLIELKHLQMVMRFVIFGLVKSE